MESINAFIKHKGKNDNAAEQILKWSYAIIILNIISLTIWS